MKALSIRQPWAWLIVNGYKDIENRSWPTKKRGLIAIHASKTMTKEDYNTAKQVALSQGVAIPDRIHFDRGCIVGVAVIKDCVTESDSPWFFGEHGFVLENAKPCAPFPYKGQLGFFNVVLEV
ncbi:MAG: hypothetical protein CMF62_06305 [Magnetococcales bacterium]|nr:hypothetical protein [Magnetococcales bacterium]